MNSKRNPIWYHVDPIMVLILYFDVFEYLFRDIVDKSPLGNLECLESESSYIFLFVHQSVSRFSLRLFFFENLGQTNLKVCHMKAKPAQFLPHPQISFHDNLVKKTFCQLIKRGKGIESRRKAIPLMQKMDAASH